MKQKDKIRQKCLNQIKTLSDSDKHKASIALCQQWLRYFSHVENASIGVFASDTTEIDVRLLFDLLQHKKCQVSFPRMKKKSMIFYQINSWHDLHAQKYNILQPEINSNETAVDTFDYVLVPGRAFDLSGNRVGRGAGFYDRFLSTANIRKKVIGLAYDFQVLNQVPVDEHDVSMDVVLTDQDCYEPFKLWM